MDTPRRKSSPSRPTLFGRAMTGAFRRLSPDRRASTGKIETLHAPISSDVDVVQPEPPDTKGPLGLTLLHDTADAQIDFIFVHGLGGGSRKTWSFSPDPSHYWPKEWLSRDPEFQHVRIHSFGYKADWGERKENVLNIHDFARDLLGQIHCKPEIRRSKTKIVLVAHSMGGIVIKKAYILAREDPELREVASRIHTMYFLATPHRGSDLAETLVSILRVSYGSKPFVTELVRNSESIVSTNDSFRHFAEDIQLWSFYETLPSHFGPVKALIVEKASATLGYAREQSALINADHRGICKFDCETDPNYQVLRNAFVTTIDKILCEASTVATEISQLQHRQLIELTRVSESPVNELATLNELRVPHTCEWIESRVAYSNCLNSSSNSRRPILWITGNAGFGKSVLSSYIISDIQRQKRKCCYFFFKHGNSVTSSIIGCLRSLAYQIANTDAQILKSLIEVQKETSSQEQWDEKTIWRRLFTGCIFKRSSEPYFWVLDGLDECHRFPALVNLLTQIPSHLRIIITSRMTPETVKSLGTLSKIAENYEIEESDTLNDLSSYIDSRIDSLPAGDPQGQQALKENILRKASGSFLWVSLVVSDLENAYSEEDAEEILNEVPTDMNEFYARMVDTLLQNPRAAVLAKALFMWTLMAFRPLQVPELQIVLKLDTNQTVPNLAKVLPAICGHLVSVNQKMEVEIIHQTAKSYLLQQESYPELELDKRESHSRMAEICLRFLTTNSVKDQAQIWGKNSQAGAKQNRDFMAYACDYFSDHLQKSSSENSTIWELLCRFLSNNVLTWVENLAIRKNLATITTTAKNLQAYLRRRVKYLSPLSSEKGDMESWITDLIRLSARFGNHLSISPSAMSKLIPPMCPLDSIIHKTYVPKKRGLVIKGLNDDAWDDCLTRIDYPGRQTSAVACGEQFSAVAVADGTILLYHQDSVQLKGTLNNQKRATLLAFSNEDRYLASNSFRSVKVWDPAEGTQVWSFDISHQPLTLLFVSESSTLATATNGNYVISWDLANGEEIRKWRWTSCVDESPIQQKPTQAPGKALFSPDYRTLAVSYRGLPIYLFDIQLERLIGCCSRGARMLVGAKSNHYVIDALSFNPSSEIDVLVASYGDGELAVFDVGTAELRYQIPEVFAHSLACSPGGRTIVTGSPRGTIQIFEFAGANGERLVSLYRIDAYDDCIKAIAFSSDSLRFADIRGTQYRIWEPAVLVCNDMGEGSYSEFSQAITAAPKSVSMMEGPIKAEITTICCSSTGAILFCGKQNGSVVYFETRTSDQKGELYQHATGIRITSIIYLEKTSLLATADESGRILVNQISSQGTEIEKEKLVSEIRLEESITSLISNPPGTRILAISKSNAEVWTTEGEKVGFSIPHNDDATFVSHPISVDHFIIIEHKSIRIFSWADSMETKILPLEFLDKPHLTLTPPSPAMNRTYASNNWSDSDTLPNTAPYIAKFSKEKSVSKLCCDFPVLNIWSASAVIDSAIYPRPIPVPSFDNLSNKISQIIALEGSLIFFLDTNLWVCSLDIAGIGLKTHGAKRHFFLLSEWQTIDGGFIINYVPATKEFVIVRKHELLVVSRGLEFEEPWFLT